MKITLAAVSVLVLAAFCSEGIAAPAGSGAPTSCCFTYAPRKIPQDNVQDYFYTSSQCSKPAVIFVTKRGRELCADPEQTWVQSHINYLELN
ncbi:C-C motif chemokine 4-like [Ambystoma mexicanum]|uniref:C-C motif chemokine 4-like n=1 Tax=Ambystoma mexicanum TaxID=8296 RepID=UPI0037E97591